MGKWPMSPRPGYAALPPLPAPAALRHEAYRGPTEESNWVLIDKRKRLGTLLVGAYPSHVDDDLNQEILESILCLGINGFVCLQQEYQHNGVTEAMWRRGMALRPYIFDAAQFLPTVAWPEQAGDRPSGLEFVHFPIVDCDTAVDQHVLELAIDLCGRLQRGQRLYIHCWGGHGRTGTVVSVMLSIMYGLTAHASMSYVQTCHDLRLEPMNVRSPQTNEQRKQVVRIVRAYDREPATAQPRTLADPG